MVDSLTSRVSLRQRLIMNQLLASLAGLTARELAREVGVSVRTIHRELPATEEVLQAYGMSLHKKAGCGLLMSGSIYQRNALQTLLQESRVGSLRPLDRRNWLTCQLLAASGPVKISALAIDLEVTMTTVGHDLDVLDDWFAPFRLVIQRKRGWGVDLLGLESDRRNAIVDKLFEDLEEPMLSSFFTPVPTDFSNAINPLLHPTHLLLDRSHCQLAGQTLRELEQEQPTPLAPEEALEIGLHLALTLGRMRSHGPCEKVPEHAWENHRSEDQQWARRLGRRLSQILGQPLAEGEVKRFALLRRATRHLTESESVSAPANLRSLVQNDPD